MAALEPAGTPDVVYWELEPGERPAWCGRPQAGSYVMATTSWGRTFMGVPFVVVGGVLLPVTFALGALFILVGGYLLGTPMWNWLKARNTIYVVTNLRLIVLEQVLSQNVMSYPAARIGRVERRIGRGGIGSLVFERNVTSVRREDGYDHSLVEERGFFGIRDAADVWRVVMDLKNGGA